jgi:hypothetical protein
VHALPLADRSGSDVHQSSFQRFHGMPSIGRRYASIRRTPVINPELPPSSLPISATRLVSRGPSTIASNKSGATALGRSLETGPYGFDNAVVAAARTLFRLAELGAGGPNRNAPGAGRSSERLRQPSLLQHFVCGVPTFRARDDDDALLVRVDPFLRGFPCLPRFRSSRPASGCGLSRRKSPAPFTRRRVRAASRSELYRVSARLGRSPR